MRSCDRLIYKDALVIELARARTWTFHCTAILPPAAARDVLEDRLRAWVARIDRFYLGRNWAKPQYADRRMEGVVFFERRPHNHAHLVLRPPADASPLHFELNARFWFEQHPERSLRRASPKPVTNRGRMHVQRVGPTGADLLRVLSYDAKEIEFRSRRDLGVEVHRRPCGAPAGLGRPQIIMVRPLRHASGLLGSSSLGPPSRQALGCWENGYLCPKDGTGHGRGKTVTGGVPERGTDHHEIVAR
jgi:hypothetical protein